MSSIDVRSETADWYADYIAREQAGKELPS